MPDIKKVVENLKVERRNLEKSPEYKEMEKGFCERALEALFLLLDNEKNEEKKQEIKEEIRNSLYSLGILGHSRSFFSNKELFHRMAQLISEKSSEEQEAKKKKKAPLINIEQWESTSCDIKKDKPCVSVIIPVYNTEKYLKECIQSISKQTLKQIEIICVDDGSTDGSYKILQKLAKKDERIKLIQKENGGQSSARNLAIENATGEYILFLDSDDYLEEKALEYLYQIACKEQLDMVMYSAEVFYDDCIDEAWKKYYERKKEYPEVLSGAEMFATMVHNREFKTSPCLYITKTSIIKENQLRFVEYFHEDNLFTPQVMYYSKRVKYVNANLYYRRIRKNSTMTEERYFLHALHYYYIAKEIEQFMVENNIDVNSNVGSAFFWQVNNVIGGAIRYLNKIDDDEIEAHMNELEQSEKIGFAQCVLMRRKTEKKVKDRDLKINALRDELIVKTEFNQALVDKVKQKKQRKKVKECKK